MENWFGGASTKTDSFGVKKPKLFEVDAHQGIARQLKSFLRLDTSVVCDAPHGCISLPLEDSDWAQCD